MGIKEIVDDYFRKLEQERQQTARVAMTVRVDPEVKERLERIAREIGESMNTVVADLLAYATMDLAAEMASRFDDKEGVFFWLAYGGTNNEAKEDA